MPQIYSKVSSASETASIADNQKLLKDISKTKKNIRERLNLHVKRRIQDQDLVSVAVPQISQPFTSSSSASLLLSPTATISIHPANTTYPFNHSIHREIVRGMPSTLLIPSDSNARMPSSNLYNSNVRLMNIAATIEQSSPKNLNNNSNRKTSPKRLHNNTNNRKKVMSSKAHSKMIETHNNLMLSPGSPCIAVDESMDNRIPILNLERNGHNHGHGHGQDDEKYCYEKNDSKLTNPQDILSMILAIKKNALMHDPEVIQFISSLR